jgi:methionyl-tRNA synthetase
MPKTFYITTAIDYTNSAPHIGHAYEKILADVIARYHRLKRDEVFFLTGVDQHGQKVQQSATKQGVAPAEFVKGVTKNFVDLWKKLDVKYDRWAATTDPLHEKCVQEILQRLWNEKKIYKDKQAGYYSVRQEQFLTDKEREANGEFGPEWGEVEFREEENYYFKLCDYKEWLLGYLQKHSDCVTPSFRQTELINAVEKISGDLCISRPKSRLDWGIELPFDKEFVNYVWFDALTNYISFIGYDPKIDSYEKQPQEFREKWPALQIIGKDILIPAHGIYWMIMLRALSFPDEAMPKFLAHGWWNISGAKMSKSLGNIVDPAALAEKYGTEAVRYYLMSDIATGGDADFAEERLIARYNSDLANSLGNLLNRALSMAHRYREGQLKLVRAETPTRDEGIFDTIEGFHGPEGFVNLGDERVAKLPNAYRAYIGMFNAHLINAGIADILEYVTSCNQLVDISAPWKLAIDKSKHRDLDAVLYHLAESLRIIAILISPVLPKAAHGIFDQLNWKMDLSGKEQRFSLDDAEWGKLPDGHVVGKPMPLFPRIETT